MSAIVGLFHLGTAKPVDPARIGAMADAQAHRGPDGSGVWTAQGVGLGHRRLSVIDVASGAQPMSSADQRIAVTCDGSIYNFRELRRELESGGARFHTTSDTEVLIHGWRAWGPALLPRLNGMFAFALFDADRQALFLARDRLGIKPLHYTRLADGSIAFASELKGLLANPAVRREPSLQAAEDYMALGYVPDDACLVAGVRKLPAGGYLLLERGKLERAPVIWWDIDFTHRATASARELEDRMRGHLRDAVTLRMISDVPLGALLSGNVDSAAVVALMAEASPKAVQTSTIGFAPAETDHADLVAKRFATSHHHRLVTAEDFPAIDLLAPDLLANAFDEPFADASALQSWRACQFARESVTVALSGTGADAVFAGYPRTKSHVAQEHARSLMPADFRRSLFGSLARFYPDRASNRFRAAATFDALAREGDEAYARATGVTAPDLRAALFSAGFKAALQGHRAEDRIVAAMRDAPARDPLDRAQYADLKIRLPGNTLTKADRTGMAVGLELRMPLLDHRLVEFGATLPVSMRLRGGTGKWLMKKAMRKYLPDDIIYSRKTGSAPPIAAWFRGPLASEAVRITTTAFAETGWFDPVVLAKIGTDHLSGACDHGRLLWQLVMLEKSLARVFGLHG